MNDTQSIVDVVAYDEKGNPIAELDGSVHDIFAEPDAAGIFIDDDDKNCFTC